MNRWLLKADAAWRLGLKNVARVAVYRLQLRLGIHPVQRVRRSIAGSHFFRMPDSIDGSLTPVSAWNAQARYLGWFDEPLGGGPLDWHRNPFTGVTMQDADQPWWKLSDFATGAGDIKAIWEASRFDWVLAMVQRARAGDAAELGRLNAWLADWSQKNPAYCGPNWKCGQEASIRVLHLALAAQLLEQSESPEPDLMRLVEAHLARITPTLSYAMAQDNNHGTSEAAALFLGGEWCARQGLRQGAKWSAAGRHWLENRVRRLVAPDGGFSQHSVNYHRLMLDTLSVVELWRRWFTLPAFTAQFYQRVTAATYWLREMTDADTGEASNLGANDGANLLPLTEADYRDYRPSVQLAAALFAGKRAFEREGMHDRHLAWLGVDLPPRSSRYDLESTFHASGYMILHKGPWKALFRYPRARFRPGHCDALHLDLWLNGDNLLRDAGSYSYNAEPELCAYFTGATGHNIVQFDDRDPMPGVGRFLHAHWLEADSVKGPEQVGQELTATAAYEDWLGARHARELQLTSSGLRVVDRVCGFANKAVLRWRLAPGEWEISGTAIRGMSCLLQVSTDVPIRRLELVDGWESRYYLQKNVVPVLEVEIAKPGVFTTTITHAPT